MYRTLTAALIFAAGWPAPPAAAEPPKARPKLACGLPDYPYVVASAKPRPSLSTTSLSRLDLGDDQTRPAAPGDPVAVPRGLSASTYQMPDAALRIDHCSVSRAAVVIAADGRYAVSFQADQNPLTASPFDGVKAIDTRLATAMFLRNQFHLTVRAYVGYPLAPGGNSSGPVAGATKAAVEEWTIDPFWVARGVPHSGLVKGQSDAAARYYRVIDRFELDFTYR